MSQTTTSGAGPAGAGGAVGTSEKRPFLAPLNRAELTLTIPHPPNGHHLGLGASGVSMMEMSPAAGSYQLPSPSFNNFMLTLSPLMQLSSPQATMSPREADISGLGHVPAPAVPSAMYVGV